MDGEEKRGLTVWEKLSFIFPYLPQFAIFAVVMGAFVGIAYFIMPSEKKEIGEIGQNASNAARGLITTLIAIVTVAIAIILTLSVVLSSASDYKERFALGKEILTILIGVLGTIVGFYFGSAPIDNNKIAPITTTAAEKSLIEKANDAERNGFDAIIALDFDKALSSFSEAEKIYPGLRVVYEMQEILRVKKGEFANASEEKKKELWKAVYCEMAKNNRTLGMSVEVKTKFNAKVSDYKCSSTSGSAE
jgi:hypothetical protein